MRWYCFDAKPFNLKACFITKCDTKFYDYAHRNGGPWTAVDNNMRALMTFSCHKMSVLIGKKSFICGRTVKLNGLSETFTLMLEMGHTSIDVQ